MSLTTPAVRDDSRPWADIVAAIAGAVGIAAILKEPALSRIAGGGLCIDAALEASDAPTAYLLATAAAGLACRGGGIEVAEWSMVLVVSRPAASARRRVA